MDKIYIEGLEVFSLIGVYDWEREHQQRLLIDIELEADLSKAAQSDNVDDTLNYASVAEVVTDVASSSEYQLIEALAKNMLESVLEAFPLVEQIKLKLSKPDILASAKNVAVEFSRRRNS